MTVRPAAPSSLPPKTTPKPDVRPLWTELTPAQQQALAPLASEWNKLDSNHKTKWLAIGKKYANLSPELQQRMHQNMADWAKLTPEQHSIARDSYARVKKLNPEQKTEQWQQYQQLPEEQKQKLAADAAAKKHVANLPNPHNKIKTVEPLKATKSAGDDCAALPSTTTPATRPPGSGICNDPAPANSAWVQPSCNHQRPPPASESPALNTVLVTPRATPPIGAPPRQHAVRSHAAVRRAIHLRMAVFHALAATSCPVSARSACKLGCSSCLAFTSSGSGAMADRPCR